MDEAAEGVALRDGGVEVFRGSGSCKIVEEAPVAHGLTQFC